MQESQSQAIYQVSTIWSHGKDIRRKKIPESQPQQSNTLESSSARSTRTTLTSRQWLLLQSIPDHQWLNQQSSSPSLSSGKEDDRQDALKSVKKRNKEEATRKRWQERSDKKEVTRRNPNSDQVPYNPSPLSFKSFIIQVPPLLSFPVHQQIYDLLVFLPHFFHRVLEVFHQLIHVSGFPPQSLITGLGGFLPETWSFESYQLSYGARMFSLSPGYPSQSRL